MVALLHVHPSRVPDLLEPDELETSDGVVKDEYVDSFGNRCTRLGRRRASSRCRPRR